MNPDRRTVLKMPVAALAAASAQTPAPDRVPTRPSATIAASPISIGFETLDRRMYDPDRACPHLAELGVKWARCQTGWSRCEPRRGEYDFAWLDGIVDNLLRIGIQPWFNLGFGNILYTPEAPHVSAVGYAPVFTEEARQAWLRYVSKLAEHFASRVKHWEIWNEPNISAFWRPEQPNAKDYTELVRMTVPAIRKRIPEAVIIGGSFAGIPLGFLEECCEAGLLGLVDKISYHPYRPQPEMGYAAEVKAMRGIIQRYNPKIGLWQGENGCPSSSNPDSTGALSTVAWNETTQAKWLLRRLLTDLSLGVELTSYFLAVDIVNYIRHGGPTGLTNYKGVIRGRDYTRKPSYFALQNLCALFDAKTTLADLLLRFGGGRSPLERMALSSACFVREGRPVYAYWSPSVLQEEFTPGTIQVSVWSGRAARLDHPVFVDLLSGEIRPARARESAAGSGHADSGWQFDEAPLRDYPMLLTDRALVS